MENSFNDLGIMPEILETLKGMNFEVPTEVQYKAIPQVLEKKDLIVISKTGSGKTATFGVPILQLTEKGLEYPQALILTPTRELAVQVDSDLKQLSKNLNKKTMAVYGQHSMNVEIQSLGKKPTIITGTPGRVFDHIQHGNIVTKNIHFLVLDEADRMLDMGFFEQVERIIKTLPTQRVTMLFSATIPYEIRKICKEYMKNPITIEIQSETKTVDTIKQDYYRVEHHEKRTQLNRLLMMEQPESCMIFCNTRIAVNQIQDFLMRKGLSSQALHGDIPQSKRMKTIQQFKQGDFRILVATDVAARGLHIDDLSLVINYDVPVDKDNYIHRIGRTGRAGNGGHSITMVSGDDIMSLYEIEEHIGAMIEEKELPTDAILRERKEAFEKWILAKAPLASPPQKPVSSKPYAQKPGGPRAHAGSPQNRGPAYRTPAAQGTAPAKSQYNDRSATPARPQNSDRIASPARPQNSDHSPLPKRPVPSESTTKVSGQTQVLRNSPPAPQKESAAPVSAPALVEKKPLIKRIFHKILGK